MTSLRLQRHPAIHYQEVVEEVAEGVELQVRPEAAERELLDTEALLEDFELLTLQPSAALELLPP